MQRSRCALIRQKKQYWTEKVSIVQVHLLNRAFQMFGNESFLIIHMQKVRCNPNYGELIQIIFGKPFQSSIYQFNKTIRFCFLAYSNVTQTKCKCFLITHGFESALLLKGPQKLFRSDLRIRMFARPCLLKLLEAKKRDLEKHSTSHSLQYPPF